MSTKGMTFDEARGMLRGRTVDEVVASAELLKATDVVVASLGLAEDTGIADVLLEMDD